MTDIIFPPWARISNQQWSAVSNTAASRSSFTGATRSLGRTGDRMLISFNVLAASDRSGSAERAALRAFRASLRGQGNRLLWADPSYAARGSFPDGELAANPYFTNGAAGWAALGGYTLTALDNVLRLTAPNASAGGGATQTIAVTPNVPYIGRASLRLGRSLSGGLPALHVNDSSGTAISNSVQATIDGGMILAPLVPATSPMVLQPIGIGLPMAGDWFDARWLSLTRCALFDGGGNLLLWSDQFDNAGWSKSNASVTANATTAPDGTATGDALLTNATSAQHYASQTITVAGAAGDFCIAGAFKPDNYNFVALQLIEGTGGTAVNQVFNLSTGALGATSNVGAQWASLRAFISPLGGGWFYCALVARKLNAATAVNAYVMATSTDSIGNFSGSTSNGIFAWRATLAVSSVPQRLIQSVGSLTAASSQTGQGLYVKGLPLSTAGLLLPGDVVQIGLEINMTTAQLDSDGAGLGYLQVYRPPRTAPNDDDPLVVTRPTGRFMLTANDQSLGNPHYQDTPGVFTDYTFEIEEALDV